MAKANDAKVSIIKLTHNISIALSGDYFKITAPVNDINNATRFTVS